jgi:hypothetical protein
MGVYLNVERVGGVAGELEGRWRSLLAGISVMKNIYIIADITYNKHTGFEPPKNNNTKKYIYILADVTYDKNTGFEPPKNNNT